MPVLRRPEKKQEIILPSRKGEIGASTDVLVVGGGPAGLGAAIGAAEAGADVILAERYGFLGGNATAALVAPFVSYHRQELLSETSGGPGTLFPRDHGPGEPVIGGALSRLVNRLVKAGGAIPPSLETGYTVPFDPEILKLCAMELLDEIGVKYLFHAFGSDVFGNEKKIEGAVLETKSGPVVIRAKVLIDCTGDGDLAYRAGAAYEIGREEDGLVQPMTLIFRMHDFEKNLFDAYARAHPGEWRGVYGLWDLVRKATEAGELDLPREDVLFFGTSHEKELCINSTRVQRVLGTDVWDLSYAEWKTRRQMRQISLFLRRYVPGFEKTYIAQSGMTVGVRESRRIVGEYRLTEEDILGARKFGDVIARGSYPIDIHLPDGKGTVLKRLPPGEAYDIPLRALLPAGVENMLVAGRCISGSHEAHSSYRVMPISVATGQAAGVCAAIAARSGVSPRKVAPRKVQKELVRQGADLRRTPPG
jgi:hypothetical protein